MKKNLTILIVLFLMAACSLSSGGGSTDSQSGAIAILDAENPFNTNVNPTSGCSSTTWVNLSTPAEIATINCSSGGGFAGAGIFTNPYRLEFSGATYVATSLNVQPSKYPESTWIAWVNPTSTNLQHILSIDNHAGAFNRALVISNSNWGVFNGTTTFEATAADLNSWQQIAIVFTASGITLYKNGTAFPMGSTPVINNTTQTLTIGRSAGGAFDFFQGAVAWVGIYPRAMTSSEIGTACRSLATRFSSVVCN